MESDGPLERHPGRPRYALTEFQHLTGWKAMVQLRRTSLSMNSSVPKRSQVRFLSGHPAKPALNWVLLLSTDQCMSGSRWPRPATYGRAPQVRPESPPSAGIVGPEATGLTAATGLNPSRADRRLMCLIAGSTDVRPPTTSLPRSFSRASELASVALLRPIIDVTVWSMSTRI
jgi:hypothetical protein